MKKTFLMCLLAAPAAMAATELTSSFNAEQNNPDLLAINGSDFLNLSYTAGQSASAVRDALKTEGNKDYSIKLADAVNYTISENIYVHDFDFSFTGDIKLTFDESGSINANNRTNFGTADRKLSITLTAEDVFKNGFYGQTLINGTIWNVDHIKDATITLSNVSDIENGGLIYSKDGKYYANASFDGYNGWQTSNQIIFDLDTDTAYLVANIADKWTVNKLSALVVPEPATATLSLLALAGLASRRRHN